MGTDDASTTPRHKPLVRHSKASVEGGAGTQSLPHKNCASRSRGNEGYRDQENRPWEKYEPAQLPPEAMQQALQLPSDGPPGFLNIVFSRLRPSAESSRELLRGCVVCGSGCYECLEGPSCLYNKLASTLPQKSICVLQLAYRPPGDDEEEATEDIMTCIDWDIQ